jgi:hypothetical protein
MITKISNLIMIPVICLHSEINKIGDLRNLSTYLDISHPHKKEKEILIYMAFPTYLCLENGEIWSTETLCEQLLVFLDKRTEAPEDNLFLQVYNSDDHDIIRRVRDTILSKKDELAEMYKDRIIHIVFGPIEIFESLKRVIDTDLFDGFFTDGIVLEFQCPSDPNPEDRAFCFTIYTDGAIESKIDWNSIFKFDDTRSLFNFEYDMMEYVQFLEQNKEPAESNIFKVLDDLFKCSSHWSISRWAFKNKAKEVADSWKGLPKYCHVIPISQVLYELLLQLWIPADTETLAQEKRRKNKINKHEKVP